MKKTIFFLLVVILSTALVPQEKFVKNSLKELEAVKDKISLSLIRVWNDEDVDDENQFFRLPTDIKIGNDNLVYILDSGNNRIQVFDGSANYIRTIGQRGQGPADMANPYSVVLDKDNNIVVADTDNRRIQVFNQAGQYLSSFKTTGTAPFLIAVTAKKEIILYGHGRLEENRLLLTYCDYSGKKLRMIGKTHDTKRVQSEAASFALDNESNVLMCFELTPYYRKYSPDGTSLMIVSFQTNHEDASVVDPPQVPQEAPRITRKKKLDIISFCIVSISVDKSGRVYLVISNRPKSKK
ncbi:MAG: 6-bladed beta-propeller, partial [bacterium]|nr:6-bladed beta-propeller [bacterium]